MVDVCKSQIQYNEGGDGVRVLTLKSLIESAEIITMHNWAENPKLGLYESIQKSGVFMQHTMEELRQAFVTVKVLECLESTRSKVLTPDSVRLPMSVR